MNTSKQIFICKKIISKYNITDGEYNFVLNKLNSILNEENKEKIYMLLGKLHLKKENIKSAYYYLNEVKKINPTNNKVYYSLLKLNVLDKKYISAKVNLEKFLKYENNQVNMELYKLLLDKINKVNNNYNIDERYIYQILTNENLILYLNGVKEILDENYKKAIIIFEELNNKVKKEKIYIDFNYVILLLNELYLKQVNNEQFIQKKELLKDYIWDCNHFKINEIVEEILKLNLDDEQIDSLIHKIPKLCNINEYEISEMIINNIRKRSNNHNKKIAFYNKLIWELKKIYLLADDYKINFQYYLRNGIDAYNIGRYNDAVNFFEKGKEKVNILLFDYYLGKTYYALKKYKLSYNYLSNYHQNGSYKIHLCKYYLACINIKKRNVNKAIKLDNEAKYFSNLLNIPYENRFSKKDVEDELSYLFEIIDICENDFINGNSKCLKM